MTTLISACCLTGTSSGRPHSDIGSPQGGVSGGRGSSEEPDHARVRRERVGKQVVRELGRGAQEPRQS
jgi:hypothetical protein